MYVVIADVTHPEPGDDTHNITCAETIEDAVRIMRASRDRTTLHKTLDACDIDDLIRVSKSGNASEHANDPPFHYSWEPSQEEQTLEQFLNKMEVALLGSAGVASSAESAHAWVEELKAHIKRIEE